MSDSFKTPWTIQSMDFSRPEYWSGQPFPSPGRLPDPGIKPRLSTLQEESLPAEPQGKPKNTGVCSLSLLQQIFLTQETNQGLRHCRQILYLPISQGSPKAQSISVFYEKAKRVTSSMFPEPKQANRNQTNLKSYQRRWLNQPLLLFSHQLYMTLLQLHGL